MLFVFTFGLFLQLVFADKSLSSQGEDARTFSSFESDKQLPCNFLEEKNSNDLILCRADLRNYYDIILVNYEDYAILSKMKVNEMNHSYIVYTKNFKKEHMDDYVKNFFKLKSFLIESTNDPLHQDIFNAIQEFYGNEMTVEEFMNYLPVAPSTYLPMAYMLAHSRRIVDIYDTTANLFSLHLSFLYVAESYRRRGAAALLLNNIKSSKEENQHVCEITLNVHVKNTIIIFYKKIGFKIEELRKNYYDPAQKSPPDAYSMSLKLENPHCPQ